VSGYSPLESGISLLPVTVIMLVFSARSGQLAARIGPRLQMSVGPLVVGAGLALLVWAGDHANYLTQVFPAVMVFGIGLAITVAPLTSTAMAAAPAEHSGVASAVNNVVARAAGLLAVAVLPLLAGITGGSALAPHRFEAGFKTSVLIAGAMCVAGGVLAMLTIRNPTQTQRRRIHLGTRAYFCPVDGAPLQPQPQPQPQQPEPQQANPA
jgi:MFS family permease